jgi:fructose-specific phosphotransferase system component IIB
MKAVDWIVGKIAALAKKLWAKLKGKFGKKDRGKKSDPDHDRKVAAGLATIDQEEQRYLKEGKISREDAEKVARRVKSAHPVFKAINVVDGGSSWNYAYVASKGKKRGEQKAAPKPWKLAPGGLRSHEGKQILTGSDRDKTVHLFTEHGVDVTNVQLKDKLDAQTQLFRKIRDNKIQAHRETIVTAEAELTNLGDLQYPKDRKKQEKRAKDIEKHSAKIRDERQEIAKLRAMDDRDREVVINSLKKWSPKKTTMSATRFKNNRILEKSVEKALRMKQQEIDAAFNDSDGNPRATGESVLITAPMYKIIGEGYELTEENEAVRIKVPLMRVQVIVVIANPVQRHYMVETAYPVK